MIYSIVDLGSNTVRLSVYKCEDIAKLLFTKKINLGLAGYVKSGILSDKGIKLACDVLINFQSILSQLELGSPTVFATASLRNIENSDEARQSIYENTGIQVELLSGEDEARLGYTGAVMEVEIEDGLMVDIGGGSAEIVICKNRSIINAISIPTGSLNLIPKHVKSVLPDRDEYRRIKKIVKSELDEVFGDKELLYPVLIGVGGTIRATARLYNELYNMPSNNREFEAKSVKHMIKHIISNESRGIDLLLKISPDRIKTQVYGMTVLWTILERSKCKKVHVSTLGVREGYLMTKLLKVNFSTEYAIALEKNDFQQELEKYPEVDTEMS